MLEGAGSARLAGKGAGRRPLFIPPRPGAARNPGQNGTPQAPPNSPRANVTRLKQIGVLRVRIFDSLSTTLGRTLLTGSRQRDGRLTDTPILEYLANCHKFSA